MKDSKNLRLLIMYQELLDGKAITKKEWVERFNVADRTFERDINMVRAFLGEYLKPHQRKELNYDGESHVYRIDTPMELKFEGKQAMSLVKILLESRAFCKSEMNDLIQIILTQVDDSEREFIKRLILNELDEFVPLQHDKKLFNRIWDFSRAIDTSKNIELVYEKANGDVVTRLVNPVGLMFSDFYFYVLCDFPKRPSTRSVPYRLDRIQSYKVLNETFNRPYRERFEEGDFRKKIHAMYQGSLITFTFDFRGHSVEAVLDRFPLAKIKSQQGETYTIEATAYEDGLIMWILSQGEWIKVLTPQSLVDKVTLKIGEMKKRYR